MTCMSQHRPGTTYVLGADLDLRVILLACHLSPFHQLFKACVYAYVYTMHVCTHVEVSRQDFTLRKVHLSPSREALSLALKLGN